jgi:hypothetical protein
MLPLSGAGATRYSPAPPSPDTAGGHLSSVLGTVRSDGRPDAIGVGARWSDGDLYCLSGPGIRTIAMRLPDGRRGSGSDR